MAGVFMSPVDPSTGRGASVPAELRCRAQDSIRGWVISSDARTRASRSWAVPLAATAAVAAAACAPVVWPLLVAAGAGTGVAVVGAALTQIGGVGGGLLSEAVIRGWEKLRSHGRPDAGEADLRDALAAELEAALTLHTPTAAELRNEVAGVLRGVEAVQVALAATVAESAAGVREVLIRGLRELGEEFTEFGWALDEVNQQLTVIAEDVAHTAATAREVADNQQQTLVELAMLRREARGAFRHLTDPNRAVLAGPSADETRAATLDVAGVPVSPACPYPGLSAFQPQDAERFFGREQLTAELVTRAGEHLLRPGLLIVLGPSGSGKSSLLRAGLLPAIAAGVLPARGAWAWPRDLMTPGRRPLVELATRIASLARIPAGALEADLRTDPSRITSAIRQALITNAQRRTKTSDPLLGDDWALDDLDEGQQAEKRASDSLAATNPVAAEPRLVLIVDQFEEIFTQCDDEQERRTFIKALCAAAGIADSGSAADGSPGRGQVDAREAPALVVIGIRADFYTHAADYPELASHMQDHQVLVGPVTEAGLREAIERPAASAGLVVDTALVEVLLADLGLHPSAYATSAEERPPDAASVGRGSYAVGKLALLSYALQQTWRNRDGRRLTVVGYRATGGIDGAVAQAADSVYNRLDPAGRDALQRLLLRLVTLGEGVPDSRRRVSLAELADSEDSITTTPARAVLAQLVDARLVTVDADTVEITHETLLTAWPRLRQWLTDDRASLRIHRDLTEASGDWQREGRDPSHLYRGTHLAVARDWATHHSEDLNPEERAFLSAAQQEHLRTRRLRRAAVLALAALTVLSAITAGVALQQRSDALSARDQAIANQIAIEAAPLAATEPSVAAQLDVVANRISPTPDSETRLLDTAATPLSSQLASPNIKSVAFSPNGKILVAGSTEHSWLWNLSDSVHPTRFRHPLTGPAGGVQSMAFSPDGKILATASGGEDDKVWLWNLTNPAHPTRLGQPLAGPANIVNSVAFSPDGKTLAAGSYDHKVWLWNLTNPAHPTRLGQPLAGPANIVNSVAFSPDGKTLAAGSYDHKVWLWNLTNPAHPTRLGQPLAGPADIVNSVAFSPDGKTLAAGSDDDKVWLWNLTNPAHPTRLGQPLAGPADGVLSVTFSPDGKTLAAGSYDDKVWLWNLTNPAHPTRLGQPLAGSTGIISSVAFSPHQPILAAASSDQIIRLWNLPTNVLTGPAGSASSVAFSPDGNILADAGGHRVWLWNLTSPLHPTPLGRPLVGPAADAGSVAFSPDGETLAAASYDKVWLWNLTNSAHPTPIGRPLTGPTALLSSVAFSPDGKTLAAGGGLPGNDAAKVWLWNVATPAHPTPLGLPLAGPPNPVSSVTFSPDGKMLAAAGGGHTVWMWNLTNPARPTPVGQPVTGRDDVVSWVSFSPDGKALAAGGFSKLVWLVHLANPAHPTPLGQRLAGPTDTFTSVAFSPNGSILAAGSDDHKVWLWNLANPSNPSALDQPLTGPTNVVSSVAFSPDGKILAAASDDGTIQLWDLNVDKATQRICATSNSLTAAQWKQYIPQLPYDPPCAHTGHYGLLTH